MTLNEAIKKYGEGNYCIFDNTKDDYIKPAFDSLEWEYLKDEPIVEFDEVSNDVITLVIETIPDEEEEEEQYEPTVDDIYRANGFASEADFWRWKEGR